ncbi:MAG: hypothetical protein QOD99_1100 [Chthoniobacter sp.]|nr:hypothetical protein [Chthoniobacter sp.]
MNSRLLSPLFALLLGPAFSQAESVEPSGAVALPAAAPLSADALPAVAEAPAQPTPPPYARYETTGVFHVRNERRPSQNPETDACVARRGDVICVYVKHLNSWLRDPLYKDRFPKDAKIADLIPYLDDVPLKGIHPEQSWPEPPDTDSEASPQVHYLRFTLSRTETSKSAWTQILNRPNFQKLMKVSVGFENGEEMRTWVLPTSKKSENLFIFTLIPPFRFWLGTVLILGAFVVFVYLARWTDIIRDTGAPLRPDKRCPYSLSRAQMAFWFFLVVGAFFFLWVIIGDTDTLNPSVLGLIGISASTALGAAFVDSGKKTAPASETELPAVNLSQPRRKICAEISKLIAKEKAELKEIETERAKIAPADETKLAANAAAQANKTQQIADLQRQLDYFEWPAWKGTMYDLLAENNAVCFHRFQIFVWTIVLGIMFVANVYNQLAMPEFSATLLGLLGISAGTYVGFKIPENNKTKEDA